MQSKISKKINYFIDFLIKTIILSIFYLFFNYSSATLSAVTSGLIHGNGPVLQNTNSLDNLSVKLYLVLDDDNSFVLTPSSDVYYIAANTQFGQIVAKVETDSNTILSYFTDTDGDQLSQANVTSLSYTWHKNGSEITSPSSTSSINTGACSTSGATNDTYVLTVNGEIKAKTTYGLPNESEAYTFTRSFTIDANNGVCYLRPADMAINNGNTGIRSISNQYDSAVFSPATSSNPGFNSTSSTGGFYYGSGFPTTAFKNAMFRIVLSDGVYNANNYTFSVLGTPSQISVQSNNQVIFNSKPENKTYYVKITKSSNNFIGFYPIKLESTNSWFTGYGSSPYWTFNQWQSGSKTDSTTGATNPAQYCLAKNQKIPRLRDLGNFTYSLDPYLPNTIISSWGSSGGDHGVTNNGYTRAISSASKVESGQGGLLTEWGRLTSYDSSAFYNWWSWTSDYREDGPNGTRVRFAYGVNQGNIIYAYSASKGGDAFRVICMEDL